MFLKYMASFFGYLLMFNLWLKNITSTVLSTRRAGDCPSALRRHRLQHQRSLSSLEPYGNSEFCSYSSAQARIFFIFLFSSFWSGQICFRSVSLILFGVDNLFVFGHFPSGLMDLGVQNESFCVSLYMTFW